MPPRSLARPASLAAATALVLAGGASTASPPAIPPIAEIPVEPLPAARKPASLPALPAAATMTTVTTTTVTTPSLMSATPEPSLAPQSGRGVAEAMPVAPAPRVVLVDEEPLKTSHTRALEVPEHGHHTTKHGRHGRPFHPAPGIVVEVASAAGGASAADLQRTARSAGYWPFRHCYEEGLRRNQKLTGSVSFELTPQAGPAGTPHVDSTLHDESVVLCVLREARHLELPWGDRSEAGGGASASMKVTLSTGDEPVPVPRAVPHADELREALHASWPAVQQCYASDLGRHPDAGGRMELKFRTKSTGEILEVSEDEPRFADLEVTRCVLGVYRTAKLPHLHGGHSGTFDYALHFEAAPPAATAAGR